MKIVRVMCNTLTAFLRVYDSKYALKIPAFQFAESIGVERIFVENGFLIVEGHVQLKGDPPLVLQSDSSCCDTKMKDTPIS
jgi:hypothetical protein